MAAVAGYEDHFVAQRLVGEMLKVIQLDTVVYPVPEPGEHGLGQNNE